MTALTIDPKKPRLLVVDDEYWGCRTVKALFARTFEVQTASSVDEVRKTFQLSSFDVAIVDYHMPGETGLVLVQMFAGILPQKRLFLVTADQALQEAGDERYTYVAKPFDPKEFIEVVTAAALSSNRVR